MAIHLVGLSHKSAALEIREKLARLAASELFEDLRGQGCPEAVVLSTCNRFEVYLRPRRPFDAEAWLSRRAGFSVGPHAYVHRGEAAVGHLFDVAAGLDSLVVGETEILGQVKDAYESAKTAGMTGKHTNVLFQRAIYAGKKVRSDTAVSVGPTSVASVAVQLAGSIFGELSRSQVLVLGAGSMAELAGRHFLSRKVARLIVANRTRERGEALAERLKAEALSWEDFPSALFEADIVVCSTGALRPVVTREMVLKAQMARQGRALFFIDIAMPRDVEGSVHGLERVYVYRLEDLEGIAASNLKNRGEEMQRARAMTRALAREFFSWQEAAGTERETGLRHSRPAEALS